MAMIPPTINRFRSKTSELNDFPLSFRQPIPSTSSTSPLRARGGTLSLTKPKKRIPFLNRKRTLGSLNINEDTTSHSTTASTPKPHNTPKRPLTVLHVPAVSNRGPQKGFTTKLPYSSAPSSRPSYSSLPPVNFSPVAFSTVILNETKTLYQGHKPASTNDSCKGVESAVLDDQLYTTPRRAPLPPSFNRVLESGTAPVFVQTHSARHKKKLSNSVVRELEGVLGTEVGSELESDSSSDLPSGPKLPTFSSLLFSLPESKLSDDGVHRYLPPVEPLPPVPLHSGRSQQRHPMSVVLPTNTAPGHLRSKSGSSLPKENQTTSVVPLLPALPHPRSDYEKPIARITSPIRGRIHSESRGNATSPPRLKIQISCATNTHRTARSIPRASSPTPEDIEVHLRTMLEAQVLRVDRLTSELASTQMQREKEKASLQRQIQLLKAQNYKREREVNYLRSLVMHNSGSPLSAPYCDIGNALNSPLQTRTEGSSTALPHQRCETTLSEQLDLVQREFADFLTVDLSTCRSPNVDQQACSKPYEDAQKGPLTPPVASSRELWRHSSPIIPSTQFPTAPGSPSIGLGIERVKSGRDSGTFELEEQQLPTLISSSTTTSLDSDLLESPTLPAVGDLSLLAPDASLLGVIADNGMQDKRPVSWAVPRIPVRTTDGSVNLVLQHLRNLNNASL